MGSLDCTLVEPGAQGCAPKLETLQVLLLRDTTKRRGGLELSGGASRHPGLLAAASERGDILVETMELAFERMEMLSRPRPNACSIQRASERPRVIPDPPDHLHADRQPMGPPLTARGSQASAASSTCD